MIKSLAEAIEHIRAKEIIIALDGNSSCGKSTLAKDLAQLLGFIHLDTGAMYRAVAFYFIENKVSLSSEEEITKALDSIHIEFNRTDQTVYTLLNGRNVETEIRSPEVAQVVSEVSTLPLVRKFLVRQQQEIGNKKKIVIDGRDIGTVVFPEADIKLFITAREEVRVLRRYRELQDKNIQTTLGEVTENLRKRDRIDSERSVSPLQQAEDAIVLDTSDLNRQEQIKKAIEIILRKLR